MPHVGYKRPSNERVVAVVETDSMGRSPELIEAMEKNDPRPPRIGREHKIYADSVAKEYAVYPKVMYRLALDDNGVPSGDQAMPSYPLPFDLAQSTGVSEKGYKIIGKTPQSPGYFDVRYPYQTHFIPIDWDPMHPREIDLAKCKSDEEKMRKAGWVDHLSDIHELATPEIDRGYDPLAPFNPTTKKKAEAPAPTAKPRP
jgi:hypothetical protein